MKPDDAHRCNACWRGDCQSCPTPDPRGRLAADDHRYPTCCCGRQFIVKDPVR